MQQTSSPVVLSRYNARGDYLAMVTVALDKQRVSVEPTDGSFRISGNGNYLYLEGSQNHCTCMDWVTIGGTELLALGLNDGSVKLYSPVANQIVHQISTGEAQCVRDLYFLGEQAWCVTGDDAIYEFNLIDFSVVRKIQLEECQRLSKILVLDGRRALVASHSIYLIDLVDKRVIRHYPGHLSQVQALSLLGSDYFLSAAENDRFLNVYNIETGSTKAVLVADADIMTVSHSGDRVVAVTTEEGKVEIFADPLVNSNNKRRSKVSKQSNKSIRIERQDTGKPILLMNSHIINDIVMVMWLENATVPYYKLFQWEALEPTHKVIQPLPTLKQTAHKTGKTQSDVAAARSYAEGNATVTSGDNFRHVQELIKDMERLEAADLEALGETLEDRMTSVPEPPTASNKKSLAAGTLVVVLSQALQSNDHSLLETVLNTHDERVIQATVTRLTPSLSVILLERLAERIARQTHRQGLLNIWCKWCLIVHGGYLITIPNLISHLASLHATLKRRAELLPRLQVLDASLSNCLNKLDTTRSFTDNGMYSDIDAYPLQQVSGESGESDVEYNEELDDAGLIDDGELEYDDKDNVSDSFVESPHHSLEEQGSEQDDANLETEDGYSDLEM